LYEEKVKGARQGVPSRQMAALLPEITTVENYCVLPLQSGGRRITLDAAACGNVDARRRLTAVSYQYL
jgi:hypothetical protein